MNRDLIKMIAMVTMLLNHIAHVCLVKGTWLYTTFVDVGYFTAITMIYFLIEGAQYTKDIKKYEKRLFVYGIISQLPFTFAFSKGNGLHFVGLNMMFSLYFCLKLIQLDQSEMEQKTKSRLMLFYYVLGCLSDWQYMAPIFALLLSRAKRGLIDYRLAYGGCFVLFYVTEAASLHSLVQGFYALIPLVISAITVLYLYNGKQSKSFRKFYQYFFYSFYPLHLTVLCIIKMKALGLF